MCKPVYPHRIRLRGPWTCESFDSGVRCRRRFHFPSQLDLHERLWLTFCELAGAVAVELNTQQIGRWDASAGPFEVEVTPLIRVSNQLVLDIELARASEQPWGEVALEVRASAYLRAVSCSINGTTLTVEGTVVGHSVWPLDLYVLIAGKTAHHQLIEATASGTSFVTTIASVTRQARIELVHAATVWYGVEVCALD